MRSKEILSMWKMGRTRLDGILTNLKQEELTKKIHNESNQLGWMLRHIGEVEHLFAKNVFGMDIKVTILTIGHQTISKDKFIDLDELLQFLAAGEMYLAKAIVEQEDGEWGEKISTKEFGTVTKAEAIARVMTHTAYHAGQVMLVHKYGSQF
jgi:uncharacterized damage-inducible protein DinB